MNILIGYAYHPYTTATYLETAMARRAKTTFVGTPWAARPGFAATGDIRPIVNDLPFRPDLYLHVDSGAAWYFPRGLTQLECPTACYLIDVHVQPKVHLRKAMFFDYAFSAQHDYVGILRRAGHPQAHWLPLACDPEVHQRYAIPKRFDVGFVGATGRGYERRRELLERLENRFSLADYRRSYTPSEMARLYSESRLVFNCSMRNEVNMRVFEGAATGTATLTDRIGNGLQDLLVHREHVVAYDDADLVNIVEDLLGDESERTRIGDNGYEHVRSLHTYDHRVAAVLDTVFSTGISGQLQAPLRLAGEPDANLAYAELCAMNGLVDETYRQFKTVPRHWRYRLAALKHLTYSAARRARSG